VLSFKSKSDTLAGIVLVTTDEVALIANNQRVLRVPVEEVKIRGKDGTGDRLSAIRDNEKIVAVTSLASTSAADS
jgi:DNA gyrase subunit A